jgi:hypothetical protein
MLIVLFILETFFTANVFKVPEEVLFNFTQSFSVTAPLRIRYVSMHYGSRFSNTLFIPPLWRVSVGKQKMGAWTSAFTIGFTLVSFNRLALY